MYAKRLFAIALGAMLCAGGAALAGDGVTVRILNDTPDALTVTIYDRNVRPAQAVVSSEVINGNASLSVSVTADASGRGHLSWTATTGDRDMRRCGHKDKPGVNDGDTIRVHANSSCPGQ
jgi:hypothetical protein